MPLKNPGFLGRVRSVESVNLVFVPFIDCANAPVRAIVSDTVLTQDDLFTVINNEGSGGALVVTLPNPVESREGVIRFAIIDAQNISIYPYPGGVVALNGDVDTGEYVDLPDTVGNYAELYCDGEKWQVTHYSGSLSKLPIIT